MNDLGLRELAPQVLGALVRKFGDFDSCEDAVQEALLAASTQWPEQGEPDNPKSWLITVASRRRIELLRSDTARQRREETVAAMAPAEPSAESSTVADVDDTLTLFQLCCHPALTESSQVALTLRAVGGLTTAEIARAYLVPEATVAQRISRAKQKIKAAGSSFRTPGDLETVLKVLYLIFNEGYTASSGESLHRIELSTEAIRLARQVRDRVPDDGEVTGLLALMLLTDARRPARTLPDQTLVPLADQDRTLWDTAAIAEGVALISSTLSTAPLGPYQVQAAIAAVHSEAKTAADTDWPQVLALYDVLDRIAPGPMVTLNRVVALAMVQGPAHALDHLTAVRSDPALTDHHRVHAVRAHLLDLAGDQAAARAEYELAARRTLSLPEQRYLRSRAARLG
ncbi:RNA polymerase subunit sigma-24 [Actinosynnema sp. ALI-1.44]|uniref:RNA polymerase sigma factor n=1 Tax=Actinosynnema sp. ALI-1.44 TaxID=1933779 RepID=UPI00097C494D|nr:sigma-70 family RNA polymerase sigma factor [Actinosynnema sp. ALI-1.44]ONI81004.1 RNA polymerase subunit sigma-24 [Actinosynnema sp. ALI-1.44]